MTAIVGILNKHGIAVAIAQKQSVAVLRFTTKPTKFLIYRNTTL